MPLKSNINDREFDRFTRRHGKTATHAVNPIGNSFQAVATDVGTDPVRVNMPEKKSKFYLRHVDTDVTVWIGDNDQITAAGDDVFPLLDTDIIEVDLKESDSNEIYAVVSAGTATLYAAGVIKA